MTKLAHHRPRLALAAGIVSVALTGCAKEPTAAEAAAPAAPAAQAPAPLPTEVVTLIDRASIENLYADYYAHFGTGFIDYSQYFTQDGVLDVNGLVARGADEIKALYVRANGPAESARPAAPSAPPPGKFHMQLTNLKVEVNGDAAKVEAFWSSIESKTLVSPPAVTEYGREHADLVKQGGHWLISKRVVTSYGGMPKSELKSYVQRSSLEGRPLGRPDLLVIRSARRTNRARPASRGGPALFAGARPQ